MKVGAAFRIVTLMDAHEPVRTHVSDQDARYAKRHPQHCGDLSDGPPVHAELEDCLALGR
jgi:hypothetical protein